MREDNDRFGTPDGAFEAARASHGADNPILRVGMYVPTRAEVATRPADELSWVLECWMWESPAELIPSYAQIREVRALIAMCDDYLDSEDSI